MSMEFMYFLEDGQRDPNRPSLCKHHRHRHLWSSCGQALKWRSSVLVWLQSLLHLDRHNSLPCHGQHKSAAVHEPPSKPEIVLWPSNSVLPFRFKERKQHCGRYCDCLSSLGPSRWAPYVHAIQWHHHRWFFWHSCQNVGLFVRTTPQNLHHNHLCQ